MLDAKLSKLTLAGWAIALLTCFGIIAVAWPLGNWVYEEVGREALRRYRMLFVSGLGVVAALFGALVAWICIVVCRRRGIRLVRDSHRSG